jgi:recombinational DNA repair protein (RecF pathway)
MHHVYTTKAFVIHSSPHGESGKFLLLFTKDFGMIGATAQGIRLIQSKLRYHIQDSSYSSVSVVRGKEVWRLTGAQELSGKKSNLLYLRVLKVLRRLIPGEDKNENIFSIIEELYSTDIVEGDYDTVEGITVLRILYYLGYIRDSEDVSVFLGGNSINSDLISTFNERKTRLIKIINESLKQTQL